MFICMHTPIYSYLFFMFSGMHCEPSVMWAVGLRPRVRVRIIVSSYESSCAAIWLEFSELHMPLSGTSLLGIAVGLASLSSSSLAAYLYRCPACPLS